MTEHRVGRGTDQYHRGFASPKKFTSWATFVAVTCVPSVSRLKRFQCGTRSVSFQCAVRATRTPVPNADTACRAPAPPRRCAPTSPHRLLRQCSCAPALAVPEPRRSCYSLSYPRGSRRSALRTPAGLGVCSQGAYPIQGDGSEPSEKPWQAPLLTQRCASRGRPRVGTMQSKPFGNVRECWLAGLPCTSSDQGERLYRAWPVSLAARRRSDTGLHHSEVEPARVRSRELHQSPPRLTRLGDREDPLVVPPHLAIEVAELLKPAFKCLTRQLWQAVLGFIQFCGNPVPLGREGIASRAQHGTAVLGPAKPRPSRRGISPHPLNTPYT